MWAGSISFIFSLCSHSFSLRSGRFLSFSRRRLNNRAKKRASEEHAWGQQKIGEKRGGGEQEGGGGGEKRPSPSAPFFLHSLPVSFPSCKLETPAPQATIHWNVAVSDHCKISNILTFEIHPLNRPKETNTVNIKKMKGHKTINILMGPGFDCSPGRGLAKIRARDAGFFLLFVGIQDPNKRSSGQGKANQPGR